MPKGLDFICENEKCKNFGCGFSIHGPFPIGDIKEVMSLEEIKNDPTHYQYLSKIYKTGELYALIPLPNNGTVKIKGVRIQLFDTKTKTIINQNLLWEKHKEYIKKVLDGDEIEEYEMGIKTFNDLHEDGLECPTCRKEMKKALWFTNANADDWGENDGQNNL